MLTRARLVVLALAALALTACGNIHPGDAAVIDGKAISMKSFEQDARVFCGIKVQLQKQQGATQELSNSEIRRETMTTLVLVTVARDLAQQKGVTPDAQTYQRPEDELSAIATLFPDGDDAKIAERLLEDDGELRAIAVALGEQSSGLTLSEENGQQLYSAGLEAIQKAVEERDIEIAPRFGMSDTLEYLNKTGSVSVSEVRLDAPAGSELPPEQRCA